MNSDRRSEPWEALSFLFNVRFTSESDYLEKRFDVRMSTLFHRVSGALTTALENPGDCFIPHSIVPITASGLQGEQPLVDRIM